MRDVQGRSAVLIVDVDTSRLERLERHAHAAGFSVATASCFAAARHELRKSRPNILVAALKLGAYNGLHLAAVAGHDEGSSAALIYCDEMVTGGTADAQSVGAQMVLADDVLQPQFWRRLSFTPAPRPAGAYHSLHAIA